MSNAPSPLAIAQSLRTVFSEGLPMTWADYHENAISAWEMTRLIREQTGLDFADAGVICAQVNPELFAEYWERLGGN